ncbi:hypothetical protein TU62_02830 [Bacillus cereus]|nr:hypothetical protein TU62_02830 [Bacillus cereus]MBG9855336.1 hypothetical protein [Bacillus wiedmannii]
MCALNRLVNGKVDNFYPALTGSKTPTQNSAKTKKLGGGSTAGKSPIGSTNNQWVMNKTPTD